MSDGEEIEVPIPSGSYAIDWDNMDLNAMDPFATKTKVSNNFGASDPTPIKEGATKNTENVKSPGSASPDENKNPESNIRQTEENTKQPEKKATKSPTKKKATEKFLKSEKNNL